jgi:hypothetical protein
MRRADYRAPDRYRDFLCFLKVVPVAGVLNHMATTGTVLCSRRQRGGRGSNSEVDGMRILLVAIAGVS